MQCSSPKCHWSWKLYLMLTLMISSGTKANLNYCLCLIIENLYQVSNLNFLVVFWVFFDLGTAPYMPTMHQWFNGHASHSSPGETLVCLCVWWVGRDAPASTHGESADEWIPFVIHVEWKVLSRRPTNCGETAGWHSEIASKIPQL